MQKPAKSRATPARAWLWSLLAFCVATHAAAQGTIVLNNREVGVLLAPVYGLEPGACVPYRLSGNTTNGYPPGCRVYTGPRLAGTWFTFALFGGPSESNLQFVGQTTFRTGAGAGFTVFGSPTVQVPGVPPGERATLQAWAWDNKGGTITTWDQAVSMWANGETIGGFSATFLSDPLGGTDSQGTVYPTPFSLVGLTSFNLTFPGCFPPCVCPPICEPTNQTVAACGKATFCFEVRGGTCDHQWYKNGTAIPGATNSVLVLTNVQALDAGEYFSIADQTNTSAVAVLTVMASPTVLRAHSVADDFAFDLSGPTGCVYTVEASSNLVDWLLAGSLTNSTGVTTFREPITERWRFYRAQLER